MADSQIYYLQCGRTIVKASLEKQVGFWERISGTKEDSGLEEQLRLMDPTRLRGDLGDYCRVGRVKMRNYLEFS